jgi:hypothetical protein
MDGVTDACDRHVRLRGRRDRRGARGGVGRGGPR